jgi:5'-methylthioadenosine phosphorylase
VLSLPELEPRVDVAVFGGSGFYSFVDHLTAVEIDTPYGPTSAAPMVGTIGDRTVAFLARHGHEHTIPAHRVNYRANVWAMAALGARALIAPFACGSLRADLERGDLVVVDQLIDRTHSREGTFFDGPETFHVSMADPYHRGLGEQLIVQARRLGLTVHDRGTVVVIPGPRFSTRAESAWHAAMGWDLVNMTQAPEAALAAEAGLAYVGIGLVTDFDAGLADDPQVTAVTQDEVFGFLAANAQHMRDLLHAAIPTLDLP